MPTTIYDSSYLTKRIQNKIISNSFIGRIQNYNSPNTGYAPRLGIYDQSLINTINSGKMTEYSNRNGCIVEDIGCPCNIGNGIDSTPFVPPIPPIPPIEYIIGWATKIGGVGSEINTSITIDNDTNIYVVGFYFADEIIIYNFNDVSNGEINVTQFGILRSIQPNPLLADAFIVKYDKYGQALWATNISGLGLQNSDERATSTTIDTDGNLYVTGTYSSTSISINSYADLSGTDIILSTFGTLARGTSNSTFIVKYNINGIVQWATRLDGNYNDVIGNGIICDSNNNVYIAGNAISSNTQTFNLSINSYNNVSSGNINVSLFGNLITDTRFIAFIAKYDSNGIAEWGTIIDSDFSNSAFTFRAIAIDTNDFIYTTGTVDIPSDSSFININSYSDISGTNIVLSLFGNLNNNNNITSNSNGNSVIVKYNTSGIVQWATNTFNLNIPSSPNTTPTSIYTDSSNNIYITGHTNTNELTIKSYIDVSNSAINTSVFGKLQYVPNSIYDSFVIKYDSNGIAQWAVPIYNTKVNNSNLGITLDVSNNIYVTGTYIIGNPATPLIFNSYDDLSGDEIIVNEFGNIDLSGVNQNISIVFVVKYNSIGEVIWVTKIQGNTTSSISNVSSNNSIYTDNNGYIYVSAYHIDTLNNPVGVFEFSDVSGTTINFIKYGDMFNTISTPSRTDIIVVRYNTDGRINM